jgi:dienelactone hydrolase
VLSSILDDSPRPMSELQAGAPSGVQRIVSRALDKHVTARYGSARELLADLLAYRAAMADASAKGANLWGLLRRPIVAIPVVAVLIAAGVLRRSPTGGPAARAGRATKACRRSCDSPAPAILRARLRSRRKSTALFKRQMAYVKSPPNARVESRDTSRPEWVREKISFDAGYETGRVNAYLILPGDARPPYQLVVLFPGVPIGPGSSETTQPIPVYDFIIKSGRAVVLPIYKGYLERWDPFLTLHGEEYLRTFRTRMAQWRQDLGNTLDVLSARPDIDPTRIADYGASFGGSTAFPLIVLEDRIKAAVLAPSGFTYRLMPPEADALNYVGRVKIPVLMTGGRHDYIFPLETAQNPMFERLGTPAEHKRHVVFDAGHGNFPHSDSIREVLAWLDQYLGPVQTATPSSTP